MFLKQNLIFASHENNSDWGNHSPSPIIYIYGPYLFLGAVVAVIVWQMDLQLPVQSVPITTNVVSSNPVNAEVYSIQHYVIKFVNDLRQVSGFLLVIRIPPPIKPTATI